MRDGEGGAVEPGLPELARCALRRAAGGGRLWAGLGAGVQRQQGRLRRHAAVEARGPPPPPPPLPPPPLFQIYEGILPGALGRFEEGPAGAVCVGGSRDVTLCAAAAAAAAAQAQEGPLLAQQAGRRAAERLPPRCGFWNGHVCVCCWASGYNTCATYRQLGVWLELWECGWNSSRSRD